MTITLSLIRNMRWTALCVAGFLLTSCASKEDAAREYLSECLSSNSVYCVNKKIDVAIVDGMGALKYLQVAKGAILKCLSQDEYAFSLNATKQKIDALSQYRPSALRRIFMFWKDYEEGFSFYDQARLNTIFDKLNACVNPAVESTPQSASEESSVKSSPSSENQVLTPSPLREIGQTRYGAFSADSELILYYGGKKLDPEIRGNSNIVISGVYSIGDSDISVVQIVGGTACPALFHIVETKNSSIRISSEFGTCSDLVEVEVLESGVSISMPDMGVSLGAVQKKSIFIYANGEVTARKE